MTYIRRRSTIIPHDPAGGLGGVFDFLMDTTLAGYLLKKLGTGEGELSCLNKANATPAVAAIDAKTEDLAKNWHPTGFYTPNEVQTLLAEITAGTVEARVALVTAPRSTSDAEQQVTQAHAYLTKNDERAKIYSDAIKAARSSGSNVVEAPGLKDWVTKSMVNISQALVTVAVLQCRETWLDRAAAIVTKIWNLARRIVGIIVKIGDTVLKAADDVLDLYQVLKWGALGVGALYVFGQIKKMRGG